jgi:tRNA nucleotidyltransferase/poly(A) polymerase
MDVTTMAGTGQFEAALKIVETLRTRGYEAYLAGGCVRDLLLGREPADYDVATSAPPEVVLEMFPRTFAVGAHFGVVLVAPEAEESQDLLPRWRRFVRTSSIPMGGIPMECGIRRPPRRM